MAPYKSYILASSGQKELGQNSKRESSLFWNLKY